ncbi:hypothetical protein EW146_g5837 [Bondarzewia mesenterica]|uniref:Uncharacterized protein n=1 Tax=Bondarzewia mesenterica TaxID=1095465 RepID=A0A4S4LQA2_9AGAM|nr:hypothetical protein EW146_g5837 [Bondarzewia mesenterica]
MFTLSQEEKRTYYNHAKYRATDSLRCEVRVAEGSSHTTSSVGFTLREVASGREKSCTVEMEPSAQIVTPEPQTARLLNECKIHHFTLDMSLYKRWWDGVDIHDSYA